MKRILYCLILIIPLICACATTTPGPFHFGQPYGAPVQYGEGRHPGIDFNIPIGTPIIAASDGEIIKVSSPGAPERIGPKSKDILGGGIFVAVQNGDHFKSLYGHLSKAFVKKGQSLKRGQLIGLSGKTNTGSKHLHFELCKTEGRYGYYSDSYDPKDFWLGGKPQCFDPNMDYSKYSQKDLTIPIACGDYAKELIAEIEK